MYHSSCLSVRFVGSFVSRPRYCTQHANTHEHAPTQTHKHKNGLFTIELKLCDSKQAGSRRQSNMYHTTSGHQLWLSEMDSRGSPVLHSLSISQGQWRVSCDHLALYCLCFYVFFFFIYILCRELIKSNISCNPNTNYSKYEWEFVLHSLLIIDVLCLFDNQFLICCLRTVFVRPTNAHTACDRIRSLEYIFKRAYKYQTQTYVHLICFTYMAGCCRHIYSTHINAFVPPVEYGNMYLYVWLVIRSACC